MKLLRLTTKNFRLLADIDVTFPETGVIGVIGSNESGKSSLIEAVCWCLFGAVALRGTKDGLRWHRAVARQVTSATLVFEVAGETYLIERSESNARLVGPDDKVLAEGTRPVNDFVPTLIGMAWPEFASSYLCQQKDIARIATMLPTERQAFIRRVMGVDVIDVALKACRKKKAELATERRGIEMGLGEREPLVAGLAEANEWVVRAQKVRYDHADDVTFAKKASEEAATGLARSELRETAHLDASAAQSAAIRRKLELSTDITRIEKQVAEHKDETARQVTDLRSRLSTHHATNVRLRSDLEGCLVAMEAYDIEGRVQLLKVRDGHSTSLRQLRDDRKGALARKEQEAVSEEVGAASLDEQWEGLEAIGAEGACPTCTHVLGDNFDDVLNGIKASGVAARRRAADARALVAELREPTDDELALEADLAVSEEAVETSTDKARKADTAKARYSELYQRSKEVAEEALGIETQLKGLEEVRQQSLQGARDALAEKQANRDETEVALRQAMQAIDELQFDEAAHDKAQTDAAAAREKLERARVALATAEEAVRGAEGRVTNAEAALAAYDERAVVLQGVLDQHLTHERTDERLSEFRVAVVGTIRPEMEELMSGFVHILTDGRHESVTLTEDFKAVLYESGVPVEVVSGGTEDVAALAMRLALSQMISQRAGHPLSLLVLDEPFASLDETRRGSFIALLHRLRGTFQQVFVVSHVAETRDMVDHAVVLEFDEPAGMTRVVAQAEEMAA